MAKIAFVDHRFSEPSLSLLSKAETIMDQYEAQNFRLTLRQLYYQMIARDLFPDSWIDPETGTKNNIRNYKKFGVLVDNGRKAGFLDWDMIEDRARETVFPPYWSSPSSIINVCVRQFRIDKWEKQPCHVEVMAEKDAVTGILTPVCERMQVRFTANRGYASSSLFYEVSQRLTEANDDDKEIHILYLGDHDPSGMDMTRDLRERMGLFTFNDFPVDVTRIALNMDQVEKWNPPENPAKDTDSRFVDYRKKFGNKCWELDAIEPSELANLVSDWISGYRDEDLWEEAEEEEQEMIDALKGIADNLDKQK